ncbi:hypothetical protein [Janibacter hoylei]|uniref:hypothetical protein n=1 Tax=Janibacter hoylei TaxID=364298 RepID=UPI0021A72E03|nr:hypothetical protein [Janibacter hoylei]MCT2292340.1 hypothetical protein [Janibacter hoylei]
MTHLEPFGYKTAWLAVLDRSQAQVAEALGLTGGRNVSGGEAAEAFDEVGLLPPVPGVDGRWTLAVSSDLADISATRLASLSALLGTRVQAFASHRVVEAHRWLLADRGRLLRHVEVVGESGELVWAGVPTPTETGLGLPALEEITDEEARFQVVLDVNEQTVMAVARGWCIDPTILSGEVPGHALLFDDVDEGPPPPAQVEAPSRTPWLWSKLVRRRT